MMRSSLRTENSKILDTDGHLSSRENGSKAFDLVFKSERLLDGANFVARSLGFAGYKKECTKTCTNNGVSGTYYRCLINGPLDRIPNKVARKKAGPKTSTRERSHLVSG
jgi:hypothetical protein